MAASRTPELACSAPCVNWRTVKGRPVPKPTWVSPRPAPSDCVTRSRNETTLALNPGVLRLARLLPTTSIAVALALSADNAAENEVNGIGIDLLWFDCVSGLWSRGDRSRRRQTGLDGVQVLAHRHRLLELRKLRQLRHELAAVGGGFRVLILELSHPHVEKHVLV